MNLAGGHGYGQSMQTTTAVNMPGLLYLLQASRLEGLVHMLEKPQLAETVLRSRIKAYNAF
jgi:hypothetical protein